MHSGLFRRERQGPEIRGGRRSRTGSGKPHLDGTPAGALRAVLYLNDVASHNGPLQCTSTVGTIRGVTGPAGTLVVFDGQRVSHHWIRPNKGAREVLDMVLIPRHRSLARGVIWPGMNNAGRPVQVFHPRLRLLSNEPILRLPEDGDKVVAPGT